MQPRREGYSEDWGKHSFNIVPADQVPAKADKAVPHGFDLRTGQMMRGLLQVEIAIAPFNVTNDRGSSVRIAIIGTGICWASLRCLLC